MLSIAHHEQADHMEESMNSFEGCRALQSFVIELRKQVDSLDLPIEGSLGVLAQGVVESGRYLVGVIRKFHQPLSALVVRELSAAAPKAIGRDADYINHWIKTIGRTLETAA